MTTEHSTGLRDTALLSAVFDAAVDAIVVSDEKGMIARVNAACAKLFGYEIDELLGKNVSVLMPPDFAAEHDEYIDHHKRTGEKRIIGIGRDVKGRRKSGEVFPLHLSVGKSQVDGQLLFIGILHDLTQRHATLEALSRSQRLDAIGQMTGGIAHDFNNLLTIIVGNLELLEMRTDAKHAHLIKDATDAAELGADLTRRLLTFARKSELAPQSFDLTEKCEEAISILKRTLGARYEVLLKPNNASDRVFLDPGQFQSALINLALNSRDAMHDGGKILIEIDPVVIDDTYIAQEDGVEPGRYVRVSFSDTGEGMTADQQARVFEPFFSTKETGKGSGLGLSMIHGFVRQSGGQITVYSEVDQGTTFSLYFPEHKGTDATGEQDAPDDKIPKGNGEIILVVEDNEKVRKLSCARLQDIGYNVLAAEDAHEALRLLDEFGRVDLLFSDVVMPGDFNGFELAEKVTQMFPEIKVLLTSGYANDVIKPETDTEKFDLLRKPYRLPDLAKRIHHLIKG